MIELQCRPRQHGGILFQKATETTILLDSTGGEYYSLDEIGGRIWELCDGRRSAEEIAAIVCSEYDAPLPSVQNDVLELLTELTAASLISADA